jgi:hypothetical protein
MFISIILTHQQYHLKNKPLKNQSGETMKNIIIIFMLFVVVKAGIGEGRSNPGPLVGVENNLLPTTYELNQNYPNPFNPSTRINFKVPESGFAKLTIFDPLGRELAVLVSEQINPGTYNVTWDASTFSSGIYFYSLTINNNKLIKKMMLLK